LSYLTNLYNIRKFKKMTIKIQPNPTATKLLQFQPISLFCFGLLLASFSVNAVETACADQYAGGVRPIPRNQVMKTRLTPVCSPGGFEAINWGVSKTGLWSAEHLTPERVESGRKMKRTDSFHVEDSASSSDRAELGDYARSGFDRGHLAPNKDMGDVRTQGDCFTLANMIPQNPNNNRVLWEGVEESVRRYVRENGDVYILTGPIFPARGQQADFLNSRVLVPTQIYKIVYDPRKGLAAGYLVNNAPGMNYEERTVADISELAQIDFFPWMNSQQKRYSVLQLPEPKPHGGR
jgi:endonuclease G